VLSTQFAVNAELLLIMGLQDTSTEQFHRINRMHQGCIICVLQCFCCDV